MLTDGKKIIQNPVFNDFDVNDDDNNMTQIIEYTNQYLNNIDLKNNQDFIAVSHSVYQRLLKISAQKKQSMSYIIENAI